MLSKISSEFGLGDALEAISPGLTCSRPRFIIHWPTSSKFIIRLESPILDWAFDIKLKIMITILFAASPGVSEN